MPKALKVYIAGLVGASAIALVVTSFVFLQKPGYVLGMRPAIAVIEPTELGVLLGVAFWVLITIFASAFPVRMPRGTLVSVAIAPIVAAVILGGPVAAGWVAAIGTTELRELEGRIPWYGTLFNHAGVVLPAMIGAFAYDAIVAISGEPAVTFVATMVGASIFFLLNVVITAASVSLMRGLDFRLVLLGDAQGYVANLFALAPLAWLMAQVYSLLPGGAGVWATLLFALPLYTTRVAHHRFVEMREMFTQTIGALAEAVDKRDPYHEHAQPPGDDDRESTSAREMRVQRRGAGGPRVGRPAPRRGQDRRPRPRPAQAGAPDQGRADADERAPGAGRRRSSRRSPSWRPSCRSSATTTSGTTARATRTG